MGSLALSRISHDHLHIAGPPRIFRNEGMTAQDGRARHCRRENVGQAVGDAGGGALEEERLVGSLVEEVTDEDEG